MKNKAILAGSLTAGMLMAATALAAPHPWDQVDERNCDISDESQPPYSGANWTWTSDAHRDHCVQRLRERGREEQAERIGQHAVREARR